MRATTAMLADAARVEGGKLFVHGGGWDSITVPAIPAVHPCLALVLVFRVEYSEALEDIPIVIDLLDEDDQPMGPHIEATLNAGHAPRTKVGTPTFVPQTISFNMLPLNRAGGFRFRVMSRDAEIASVPFRVHAMT
jgi:hypothetical protein